MKEYCSQRGLPINGKYKDELVALEHAATVAKLPCVLSKNEESQCVLVAAEYQQLLGVGEAVMPDPLTEPTVGWQSQEDGIKNKDLFIVPVVVNCAARLVGLISEKGCIKELTITLAVIP